MLARGWFVCHSKRGRDAFQLLQRFSASFGHDESNGGRNFGQEFIERDRAKF